MSGSDDPKEKRGLGGYASAFKARVVQSEIWLSIFKHPFPKTPTEQAEIATRSFLLHLRPAIIHRKELKFTTTFRLGALSTGLFMVLAGTGVLMMFYYVPATDHAYKDMVDLQNVVSLGKIIRNLHHWAAYGMLILVCLHMLRVFITKAYRSPRQFNWVVGICLLVLTLLLSFTGYLLPWDQLAYWGVTIGSNMAGAVPVVGDGIKYVMLGGTSIDQPTLTRFYVLHVMVLPMALTMLLVYHFWRIRKDGHSGGDPHA